MCLQGPENVLLTQADFNIILDCGRGALPSCVSEQVVAPVSLWPSASELRSDGRGKRMWRQPVAFWRFQLCNTTALVPGLPKTEGTSPQKPVAPRARVHQFMRKTLIVYEDILILLFGVKLTNLSRFGHISPMLDDSKHTSKPCKSYLWNKEVKAFCNGMTYWGNRLNSNRAVLGRIRSGGVQPISWLSCKRHFALT